MPEHFFASLRTNMTPERKTAFFTALIIGFFTHLYAFVNYIPNHDGLINIYNTQLKFKLGRFFLSPSSGIGSFFDLPLVNGLLSIFYLALLAIVLVEIFHLKKKVSIFLASGLIVTFPTVTSTFSYMFTADGYMFGFLLAGLAVLITQKYRYGFVAGAVVFYVSVGIYQANLPFALTLIALTVLQSLLSKTASSKYNWKKILSYGAMVSIGMLLYALTFKIYQTFFTGEISEYQGLDEIGETSGNILLPFMEIGRSSAVFLFSGFTSAKSLTLFDILNVLMIFVIIASFGYLLRRVSLGTAIAAILLAFSLPLLAYSMYFISPGVEYHMLMVMGLSSLYLLPAILYEHLEFSKFLSWSIVLILGLTIFNFSIIANISYFNTSLKYEKSLANANRVLDRIEQTDGYENASKLAIFGTHYLQSELGSEIIPDRLPVMTGVLGETALSQPYHYKYMLENQFGVSFELADDAVKEQIASSKWYEQMPIWPHADSIRIVNDVIILKLSR